MPILQQPLISMFIRTWNRRKSASPRCSSRLENREEQMKAEYREVIRGQSENSVAILLSGYSFVSLRHETMASITDSIS